ncbi:threonine aspartase, involved in protein processing [Schizosaccharomyces osmophilus]|uniref:Threonine aspartase, involved in protein processing n=1 Tax=Schizosaccharomyces osmophilus TaxID=2545709 RepID=A0AAF0AX14_9SCHI|nr:threonine aspartase, involved in protein processing [Schizosaccharomyces osmophilus]WBW73444.1 threonine aspartase, involved in protein processing [Schizosaccharomyces osmophilus]
MNSGFVIVHAGAGLYSERREHLAKDACAKACMQAKLELCRTSDSIAAAIAAVKVLEDSPVCNAGTGSNLTVNGEVECEAGLMESHTGMAASVGACRNYKYPSEICSRILSKRKLPKSHGRIPPLMIVSHGVSEFLKEEGIPTNTNEELRTDGSRKQYEKWKQLVEDDGRIPSSQDTVGAICIDPAGEFCVCCSSGGILLKSSGRIGSSAIPGHGFWLERELNEMGASTFATCMTGTGEHISNTNFAIRCSNVMLHTEDEIQDLERLIRDFWDHPMSKYIPNLSLGFIFAKMETMPESKRPRLTFGFANSSPSMAIGYMKTTSKKPHVLITRNQNKPHTISVVSTRL